MQEEGVRVTQIVPLHVVVLGAGSIGLSFAAAFGDAGAEVTLADPDPARREAAPGGLALQREAIGLAGLTRGAGGQVTVAPAAEAV